MMNFVHFLQTWPMRLGNFPQILFFVTTLYKRPFSKMASQKTCGQDILLAVELITFIFYRVVLWLTFGEKFIKNNMTFWKNDRPKNCGCDILWTVGWIAFKFVVVVLWVFLKIWLTLGENIKNKMADGWHFEKIATRKKQQLSRHL